MTYSVDSTKVGVSSINIGRTKWIRSTAILRQVTLAGCRSTLSRYRLQLYIHKQMRFTTTNQNGRRKYFLLRRPIDG